MATPLSINYTLDTSAPTLSINTYPTINLANVSSYTFGGACSEEARNVDYNIGGVTGSVVCSSSAWSVSLDVSSLTDSATVSITADHSDQVGNNAPQATKTVLKDTVRPTPLTIGSPADGAVLGSASQTISGTCENGASINITGDITGAVSGTCSSGNYSLAINLSSGDGVKNISIDQLDAAGNSMASALSVSYTLDTTGPTVAQVNSDEVNGNFKAGDILEIMVIFDTNVTVSGSPSLTLETGSTDRAASYTRVDNGSEVIFTYTVQAGDNSPDLDYVSISAISLNGGTIQDQAGNNADTTLALPGNANSLSFNKNLVIDTLSPIVAQVRSPASDGVYSVGQTLDIEVIFSESVLVSTGVPQIALNSGATVDYTSGSGTNTLVFSYTVAGGENSSDLDYVATNSLSLNGAVIHDAVSNNADLSLASPGAVGSISDNQDIIIQSTPPAVAEVSSSTSDGHYKAGDSINISVVFNKIVSVTGAPQISLNSGATVDYSSGSGSNTLIFTYTVASSENSADLDYISTNSLSLNGGTIKDSYGVDADLALAGPGAINSVSDDKAIVVDTIIPTVSITSSPDITDSNKTAYTFGGTCSEDGQNVSYTIGGETGSVLCSSGSWSATHDTVYILDDPAVLITADLADLAGNNAVQASVTVDKTTTDTTAPVITITSPSNGDTVFAGGKLNIIFNISDNVGVDWSYVYCYTTSWKSADAGSPERTSCTTTAPYPGSTGYANPGIVKVLGRDSSGNTATASVTLNFNEVLNVTSPAEGDTLTSDSFTITGTCDSSLGDVKLTASYYNSDGNMGATGPDAACSSGSFSLDATLIHTIPGSRKIQLYQDNGTQSARRDVSYTYEPPVQWGNRITGSKNYFCFLHEDKSAFCWGEGEYGSLGSGTADQFEPREVSASYGGHSNSYIDISAGDEHACAVHADSKEILCWGEGSYGRRGDNITSDTSKPRVIDMSSTGEPNTFNRVSAGYRGGCGVHTSGKIFCWGASPVGHGVSGDSYVPVEIDMSATGLSNNFKEVYKVGSNTCGLHDTKKIFCWGYSSRLGDGSSSTAYAPVEIDMSSHAVTPYFKKLSKGYGNSVCAIHESGKVYCWGGGTYGTIGDGFTADRATPVEIDMSMTGYSNDFVNLGGDYYSTCGVHANGMAFCWGDGSWGRLGYGGILNKYLPEPVTMSHIPLANDFTEIAVADDATCALHSNGQVYCVGDGMIGQLGSDSVVKKSSVFKEADMSAHSDGNDFIKVSTYNSHNCGVHSSGRGYCWGKLFSNSFYNPSPSNYASSPLPINASASGHSNSFQDIQVGIFDIYGLHTNGEVLRISNSTLNTSPIDMSAHAEGNNFKQLSAGGDFYCAIHATTNELFCWGDNYYGQLGDGSTVDSSAPIKVNMSVVGRTNSFYKVAAGSNHTCAIHTSGEVWCWGKRAYSSMGNGDTTSGNQLLPVRPDFSSSGFSESFTDIDAGQTNTCVIHSNNGEVLCWGKSGDGLLGSGGGYPYRKDFPTPISYFGATGLGNSFTSVSLSKSSNSDRMCAVHATGKMLCWGDDGNNYGIFANGFIGGTYENPSQPIMSHLSLTNSFLQVDTIDDNTCAIYNGGPGNRKLMCSGSNESLALGSGDGFVQYYFVPIDNTYF